MFYLYWHLQFTNPIMYPNKRQRKLMFICYLKKLNEFQRLMKENKILGMNSLFKNMLNKL
jgi:hypothetical protein